MTPSDFTALLLKLVSGGSSTAEDEENNRPLIYHDEIFVPQQNAYDCGFCCLKMSINYRYSTHSSNREQLLRALDASDLQLTTSPLWTVDLFCFLREHDVEAVMYTTCAGINNSHSKLSWYHQTHCDGDIERVARKFELVKSNKWQVQEQVIPVEKVIEHVNRGGASAIMLINSYSATAVNSIVGQSKGGSAIHVSAPNCSVAPNCSADQYTGHYIYIISFDNESNVFAYLDPARGNSAEKYMSPYALDNARSHRGTDHDVIFIWPGAGAGTYS